MYYICLYLCSGCSRAYAVTVLALLAEFELALDERNRVEQDAVGDAHDGIHPSYDRHQTRNEFIERRARLVDRDLHRARLIVELGLWKRLVHGV